MTNLYELFETDTKAEIEGFWHPVTDTSSFKLARAGGANTKFIKMMESLTRPHRRKIDDGSIDNELASDLMQEAFAQTVILDWKGVTDKGGKAIKFSPQAAHRLMQDLPELFSELRDVAAKHANFRLANIEADTKN